jgi:hypothetical protein
MTCLLREYDFETNVQVAEVHILGDTFMGLLGQGY